ncbi:MAG: N-acetylmuramoyl-L-alanine amidase, partial [Oscillospiraceae bacterium]|nr:N-acetylmuramoyl-L-alanine amidase [Oscillospiraceae bacterium]
YFAEVKSAWAFVYPNAATTGGPSGELCLGQRDYVTGVTGDGGWVRLGLGGWIPAGDVKREMSAGALSNRLESAEYRTEDARWDLLTLSGSAATATQTAYDGKALTLTVTAAAAAPAPSLPTGTPFSDVKASLSEGKAVYTLTLKAGVVLDGYYVTAEGGKLVLHIKKHPQAAAGATPLTGFTILLDPGHGGDESGALSPLPALPEKTVNLYTALKVKKELEALGATVLLTRSEDVTLSLAKRVEASRALRPDLFLSIHGNSVDDSTDATNIYGISSWYREAVSLNGAESLYKSVQAALGRGARRANQSNLYVCRPCWTPSVILETGFLCNPGEADWMADNQAQNKLAAAIAQAVAGFFRG